MGLALGGYRARVQPLLRHASTPSALVTEDLDRPGCRTTPTAPLGQFFRVLGRVGRGGPWSVLIRPQVLAKHRIPSPCNLLTKKKKAALV